MRVAATPDVVVVQVDGGRLRTRATGAGPGVHGQENKEDKVARISKMVAAQAIPNSTEWVPTVKLSDDEGKHTGSEKEVNLCLDTLGIKNKELEKAL